MKPLIIALGLLSFAASVPPALATGSGTEVHVALLDMSSLMSRGRGPGMMNRSYGPGWGMMNMGRMAIRSDHASVKAGEVHFVVTNWSQGIVHEMIVVAVDNPDAPLPYDYDSGRVPEDQIKSLGEVSDLAPNATGTLDVNLAPGAYLVICNVPGHYEAGMATNLTVTP